MRSWADSFVRIGAILAAVIGLAGREAVFDSPNRAETIRVRYFLGLYQVAYHGPRGSEDSKNATAFLDSFNIMIMH